MIAAKKPVPDKTTVIVRQTCSTYVVRAHGRVASCTAGAGQAVRLLTEKLWGNGLHGFAQLEYRSDGSSVWGICKVAEGDANGA